MKQSISTRLISFLLALVMILGMLPATAVTANAAQYTAVGVSVQSDGVVCDDGWYYLDDPSIYLLYSDNGSTFASSVSPLYTDEECLDYLTSAPVLGEKYYFQVFAYAYSDTDYSVTNSKSSIDVEGFCSGRVKDAYKDGAVYIVTCSIIYGELTGGVKAVASGVAYDSAEGGYAPTFTTLKAVSTEGKELEHVKITNGQYNYSYYGAKSGCLYKTNKGTSFSDMLTTEPQEGETYYSYFLLYSIDGNLNIEEDLVDIQIPGYEVEYIASYERDMGFTSLVVYSVTKMAEDPVYVGGVGMCSGDYLAVGATKTQTTKPSGGYAYYKDGTLTLNNYSYTGEGYEHATAYDLYAAVYSATDLTLNLVGSNTLVSTSEKSDSVYTEDSLTVGGSGSLTCTSNRYGLQAHGGELTINSGTIVSTSGLSGIKGYFADVIINGGDITINSCTIDDTYVQAGIYAYEGDVVINGGNITANGGTDRGIASAFDSVYINGGNVTAVGSKYAIEYEGEFVVADGLQIRASTTENGALGEYVAANHDSYQKIVVRSASDVYVGGVGMSDGDYLAVGATATQTTKPSGGYAYFKDGTLTLNNYSYEGEGYKYGSVYARGTNLTIELLGDNTLVQTKSGRDAICTESTNLTIGGTGNLTCRGEDHGIWVGGKLTINGGEITAIGNTKAIRYTDSSGFTVAEGLTMQASTTADGALGEYVAENHDSYKKIVIKPVPTHTVTFKVDTTTVATKTVEDGKTVTAPADPTQSGKTFLGWYNGDTKFDFTTPITGDITLTAKWEKIEMPTAPEVTGVTRIAGADRYTTSFLAADQLKAKLGVQKFNTIVVASGTDFADALSGSYLAAVKDAPMLLVRSRNKEINAVKDYIKANLVSGGTVYLLGGPNAVPKTMETGLDGFTVKRLGGATRYATNLLILEEAGVAGKDILVCTGKGFADSLSASAAKQPILLVKDNLDNNQKNFLSKQNGKIYIIGGTGAVSTRIENQLKTYGNITRLGGATRYITSVMVAETFFKNPKAVVLAYSENFPDGLSGGALACGIDAPLILVKGGKDSDAAKYTTAQGIKTGYIMGGAGLIPDRVVRKVFSMAAEDTITIIK